MSPFRDLAAKPWLPRGMDEIPAWGRLPVPTAGVGLVAFLAVATVLFSLLVAAYLMRMGMGDWRPVAEPPVLWLNTLALVLASLSLHRASVAARSGRTETVKVAFAVGGLLALGFLAGQFAAWRQLGYQLASSPALSFFYLVSAVHGMHLLGGLVAWVRVGERIRRGTDPVGIRLGMRLCAGYWHFLLVVWLALFGLLLADDAGWMPASPMLHAH